MRRRRLTSQRGAHRRERGLTARDAEQCVKRDDASVVGRLGPAEEHDAGCDAERDVHVHDPEALCRNERHHSTEEGSSIRDGQSAPLSNVHEGTSVPRTHSWPTLGRIHSLWRM